MKRIWIPEAPYIHRRRLIEGELRTPTARIQGIMHVDLVHARTGLIARSLTFPNLIVNAGMDGIAASTISALTSYCGVGTGNSAPAVGQTDLDVSVIRTNSSGSFAESRGVAGDLSYCWWKRTRVFTTAQANDTLAEIGFFSASSGGTMFARQLIKDELGNPTTITKTSEYELRVTYEVRWYVPADTEYSALIDGVSQTIRTRACRVVNNVPTSNHKSWSVDEQGTFAVGGFLFCSLYTGSMSADVTGVPSGSSIYSSDSTQDAYVAASYERTMVTRIGAATGNGVNYITFVPGYQAGFSRSSPMLFQHEILGGASVIKNDTQRFDVYSQISWARYP